MKRASILFLSSLIFCTGQSKSQTFNPSATNLLDAQLNQTYIDQVINFTVPATSTLPGSIVEQALVLAYPQAATGLSLLNLSSRTFDFNVTRATFSVDGLPQGMSGNCDATPCTYLAESSGTITIAGTPTESGNFTFDILSYTEGDVDLSSLGGGALAVLGIPSSFDLPAPVPEALDETGYTIDVLDASGIEETNSVFSLSIYPNPTQDVCLLELRSKASGILRIELFSVTGSKVQTHSQSVRVGSNRINLDVANLPTGIYMVRTDLNGHQALIRVQKI